MNAYIIRKMFVHTKMGKMPMVKKLFHTALTVANLLSVLLLVALAGECGFDFHVSLSASIGFIKSRVFVFGFFVFISHS